MLSLSNIQPSVLTDNPVYTWAACWKENTWGTFSRPFSLGNLNKLLISAARDLLEIVKVGTPEITHSGPPIIILHWLTWYTCHNQWTNTDTLLSTLEPVIYSYFFAFTSCSFSVPGSLPPRTPHFNESWMFSWSSNGALWPCLGLTWVCTSTVWGVPVT